MGHPGLGDVPVGFVLTLAVAPVMVIVVIFVVPVTFVHLPALLVVVVVGMVPVGASVGWLLPDAAMPDVAASVVSPVAIGPHEAYAGCGWADFIAQGRWGATDVDVDLGEGWGGEGGEAQAPSEQS
jgi:hypothetical protein